MAFIIPVQSGLTNFSFEIEIDSKLYNWNVYWNERDQAWYFDLFDEDLISIIYGVKLVPSYQLLKNLVDERFFTSKLYFLRETKGVEPSADNLNIDFNIYVLEEGEEFVI